MKVLGQMRGRSHAAKSPTAKSAKVGDELPPISQKVSYKEFEDIIILLKHYKQEKLIHIIIKNSIVIIRLSKTYLPHVPLQMFLRCPVFPRFKGRDMFSNRTIRERRRGT
jgi:hypothetical protein